MVEARAISRYVRISPRKARDVANLIKGRSAEDALNILKYTPKKAALITGRTLRSAISNATNKDKEVKAEDLVVVNAYVGQGPTLKRFRARAMGRVARIAHRTSHIYIVVRDK